MEDITPPPYDCSAEYLTARARTDLKRPFLRHLTAANNKPRDKYHKELQLAEANRELREPTTGQSGQGDPPGSIGSSLEAAAVGATPAVPANPEVLRDISDEQQEEDEHHKSYHHSRPLPASGAKPTEVPQPGAVAGDMGDSLTSPAAKAFWTTRLDDAARKAFEQSAATAAQHRQQFPVLQQLCERAKKGDRAAIDEIRLMLDSDEGFWRTYGDAAGFTETILIDALAGDIAAVEKSVRRSVADMRKTLLGENPRLLERMTVERVIGCWLHTLVLDRCGAVAVKQGGRASDLGKAQESAEKQYLTALKSLKLVQEIESPADRQSKKSEAPKSAEQASVA